MFTKTIQRVFLVPLAAFMALGVGLVVDAKTAAAASSYPLFSSAGITVYGCVDRQIGSYQDMRVYATNRDSKAISSLLIYRTSTNQANLGYIAPWGTSAAKTLGVPGPSTYSVRVKYSGLSYYITLGSMSLGSPKNSGC